MEYTTNKPLNREEIRYRLNAFIDTVLNGYLNRGGIRGADYNRCLRWKTIWINEIPMLDNSKFHLSSTLQDFIPDNFKNQNIPLKGLYGMMDFLQSIYQVEKTGKLNAFHGAQARTLASALAIACKNPKTVFNRNSLRFDVSESQTVKKLCDSFEMTTVSLSSALGTQLGSVCGNNNLLETFKIGKYDKKTKQITLNEKSGIIRWLRNLID